MSFGQRYYDLLMKLLPDRFRQKCGLELWDTFNEMRSELDGRPGPVRLGRFYFRLTIDLFKQIRAERARTNRRNSVTSNRSSEPHWLRQRHSLGHIFERMFRDIRIAMRALLNRPVFLAVAMLSLALGIGANTAIFSVVNAFFIKQYAYENPDELVFVYTRVQDRTQYGTTSFPNYEDIRDFDEGFRDVGTYKTIFARVELQDETLRVLGEGVSHTLFPMLGIEAAVGRTFLPEEDEVPGAHAVAMLGYGFWHRAFGGDPNIVGSTVRIGGQSYTVVGITPEGFQGLSGAGLQADFFVPIVMYGAAAGMTNHSHFQNRLDRRYFVVGRMKEGASFESTAAGLDVLSRQIQQANPHIDVEWAFSMVPLRDVAMNPDTDRAVLPFAALLMTAGGLVLILACTNLASFLLARATNRRKEIALRLALGATRGILIRQLLTETVLLALLGGSAGLLLANWTLGILQRFQPPLPIPISLDLGLDHTVLLFAFGISAAGGLLFGMAPALQSTNPDVAPTLKDETGTVRLRRFGLRNILVALQMSLSVLLLVGGGLFVRSLGAAKLADLGFSTREAGIASVDLWLSGIPQDQFLTTTRELVERARALPGVEAATAASHIPLFGFASGGFYTIPDAEPPVQGGGHNVEREEVGPTFFETMGIPLKTGRAFTDEDNPEAPLVAIVNETAAQWFWPGMSPIGREFSPLGTSHTFTVVGVVSDTKIERLREPPKPLFYFPFAQAAGSSVILVATGSPPAAEIAAMLRQMIRETSRSLMVTHTGTMEDNIGVILYPARMAALLLSVFGVLALTLATIGLYGVVSFSVSQRTKEVGIRLSLGANRAGVIRMIMKGAMSLVGVGGIIGLAAAVALAQLLRHVLYGIGPWDPWTIVGVPLLLSTVAALAALIPARRASMVNPVRALKYD